MKIGFTIGGSSIDEVVSPPSGRPPRGSRRPGWRTSSASTPSRPSRSPAAHVPGIHLGTAVVPTFPRHPHALAQQALTTWDATGGRFTLGIGLSHQIVIETMFGLSYDKPAVHMREYLSVLLPLLRDGTCRSRASTTPSTPRSNGPATEGGRPCCSRPWRR